MAIKEIKREWSPEQLDYVKHFLLHYERDVKDLPKCCVGSRATVSETDNEYVCADCGWIRAEFVELSTICPTLLSDPDVEIYYDPEKTEIADNEFRDNTDIQAVYFPNVTTVGMAAFNGCVNLISAVLPKVQSVSEGSAFIGCKSLKKLILPELTGKVGSRIASNCSALETVSMPKVTELKMGAEFQNDSALRNVEMPELVTLNSNSFYNCTALTKLDFPKLEMLNCRAITGSAVNTLILRADTVCALDSTFRTDNPIGAGTGYIYVPAALIEDYKVATNWKTYAAQFRAIEDYPEICDPDLDQPITKGDAMEMVRNRGVCIVNVACDMTVTEGSTAPTFSNVTSDKTYDELKAAYDAGAYIGVRLLYNNAADNSLPAGMKLDFGLAMFIPDMDGVTGFMFTNNVSMGANMVSITSDGTVTVAMD